MTTQTILIEPAPRAAPYPDAPPRDDMQNLRYLHLRSIVEALSDRFGNPDATLIRNEVRLGPSLSAPEDTRVPDLMVAFNCDVAQAREDNGYSLESQPRPPEFALEVASKTTGIVDYTEKRADYERYGVGEYWRFDPTGGDYHDDALAGDRLVEGRYARIAIEWTDDEHARGYSDALGLFVCWEREQLRFYDPAQGRYLRTLTESEAERRAEAAGRRVAEARADAEAARRRRADEGRRQAEARADAEAARADAEAEARRRTEARLAELERERRDGGA